MDILIKIIQLILALSIMVFLHELGHFVFARLFKVRVNKFYLFFNPKFSIIRFKKINGKYKFKFFSKNDDINAVPALDENGNELLNKKGKPIMVPAPLETLPDDNWNKYPETTEWGIGWIPLGGYCAIDGMVDESMDPTIANTEPKPWEYRSQKAWKRMLIISGGVIMNFLTAIVIYSIMLMTYGDNYMLMKNAYLGYDYCQTALNNGLQNGDIIITADGDSLYTDKDALQKIVIEGKEHLVVLRNGSYENVVLPSDFGEQFLKAEEQSLTTLRFPMVIDNISDSSTVKGILEIGDSIIGVNDEMNLAFSDITKILQENKGEAISINYYRNGTQRSDTISLDDNGKMGITIKNPINMFQLEHKTYSFFSAIPNGIIKGWETLVNYVKQFRLVFTKEGAQSLGGFIAIGNVFPSQWDWIYFWNIVALLSIILAFMNFLPIPALDGGYFIILIYEMITGKKPSDRFMEIATNIGMLILLILLVVANGNDIIKLFR